MPIIGKGSELTLVKLGPPGQLRQCLCRCSCGTQKWMRWSNVKSLHTKSCGCKRKELIAKARTKHGHRPAGRKSSGAYASWRAMNQRCNNPEFHAYPQYGGQGILICHRWASFANFLADMGERPKGMTLDRKNNKLGYSPRNCRWASRKEQGLNRSTTKLVKAFGRTLCLRDWAKVTGIARSTLQRQMARSTPRKVLNRYRERIQTGTPPQ